MCKRMADRQMLHRLGRLELACLQHSDEGSESPATTGPRRPPTAFLDLFDVIHRDAPAELRGQRVLGGMRAPNSKLTSDWVRGPLTQDGSHRATEDCIDRQFQVTASSQGLLDRRKCLATLEIASDLIGVVRMVGGDEVAELSGQHHVRADLLHAACDLPQPKSGEAGKALARASRGEEWVVLEVEVDTRIVQR